VPSDERNHEYYIEKIFRLDFTGVYPQLFVFLERIASLQKILRVDGFDIKPVGPQNQKYVEIGGSLRILAYRYSGSRADEIGTGGAPAPASTGGANPAAKAPPAGEEGQ